MALPEDIKLSREEIIRDLALSRAISQSHPTDGPNEILRIAKLFERYIDKGTTPFTGTKLVLPKTATAKHA